MYLKLNCESFWYHDAVCMSVCNLYINRGQMRVIDSCLKLWLIHDYIEANKQIYTSVTSIVFINIKAYTGEKQN